MLGLAALPSSSVALVVVHAAGVSVRAGLAVAAGIVVGDLIFATLAILGLGALAELLGAVFGTIRYLAAGYLIWLGIRLLRSATRNAAAAGLPLARGLGGGFLAGLAFTLSDIKAILFYASLFPAFVDLSALTSGDILAIMAITAIAVGGVKAGYALAAPRIARGLGGTRFQAPAKAFAGVAVVGAGGYLLTKS